MASAPRNPDTRELPYGWVQQYNQEYRQWYYVDTRVTPSRSSWEHPLGPMPQNFAPPPAPPVDRSYNRSPYGGPPPPQGYGGYPGPGYQSSYGGPPPAQGYYNAPSGGYANYPPYPENRGYSEPQRVAYVEEERKTRKGPGWGGMALAGGAGILGGLALENVIRDHDEREREEGFDRGYDDGYANGYDNGVGDDYGDSW